MVFKPTIVSLLTYKNRKKALMLQVGPDRLKTLYCIYFTYMLLKQIIGISFKTVQHSSRNMDLTKTEIRGDHFGLT